VEINNINPNLHYKLVEDVNEEQNVIRSNMNNAEDVAEFLTLFQEKTNTNWIIQVIKPRKVSYNFISIILSI